MNIIKGSYQVCVYELRILSRNYKIYTIPVCLFIFMSSMLQPLHSFLTETGECITPFLFSLFMGGDFCAALIFSVALLFFIDAPFYDKEKLFVMIRCGKAKWILGHIFYIIFVSIVYVLAVVLLSIFLFLPKTTFANEWGRVWTTLAYSDIGSQIGLGFPVYSYMITNQSPLQVLFVVFCISCLVCIFYGICTWLLNMYIGKILSVSFIMASILLVTRIRFMPHWMMYLVPSAWANISNLSKYTKHGITLEKAVVLLLLGISCFTLIAARKTWTTDLAKG